MKICMQIKDQGFTLAELMAVVVIIAILAGVGFGSYVKSVSRAKFAEGRSLAQQVAAARDTYYYDHQALLGGSGSSSFPTDFSKLSIGLKDKDGNQATGSSFSGKNCTVTLHSNYVKATAVDGGYALCVYQDTPTRAERCVYTTTDGKDFCESMGYDDQTSC